jgi:hypothetical protein
VARKRCSAAILLHPTVCVGTGFNDIYTSPVASGLLGDDASNGAKHVARQIERNFDWATLAAFSKEVNASNVTTTRTTVTRVYVYDRRVLSILLIPVIAMVMSAWGRLRVGSDEVVREYDPVAIAQLEPVEELPLGGEVKIDKGEVKGLVLRGQGAGEYVKLVVGRQGKELLKFTALASFMGRALLL